MLHNTLHAVFFRIILNLSEVITHNIVVQDLNFCTYIIKLIKSISVMAFTKMHTSPNIIDSAAAVRFRLLN